MRYEARNMRRFARNFATDRRVRFPTPIDNSLCSSDVIVETFEEEKLKIWFSTNTNRNYAVRDVAKFM